MNIESCLTVKIPLNVDDSAPLIELLERCRDACNYVSEQASYLEYRATEAIKKAGKMSPYKETE